MKRSKTGRFGVVRGLMTLIESRASHNAGSTENVVRYAQALGREIQYPQAQMRDLVYGTVLRDVGMLACRSKRSDADRPTQRRRMGRTCVGTRSRVLPSCGRCASAMSAVEVVLHHHEAYNGEGYPMKLRGQGDSARRAHRGGCRVIREDDNGSAISQSAGPRRGAGKPLGRKLGTALRPAHRRRVGARCESRTQHGDWEAMPTSQTICSEY